MGWYIQIKTAASRVWRVIVSPVRLPRLQSIQTPSLIKVELDMMRGAWLVRTRFKNGEMEDNDEELQQGLRLPL